MLPQFLTGTFLNPFIYFIFLFFYLFTYSFIYSSSLRPLLFPSTGSMTRTLISESKIDRLDLLPTI